MSQKTKTSYLKVQRFYDVRGVGCCRVWSVESVERFLRDSSLVQLTLSEFEIFPVASLFQLSFLQLSSQLQLSFLAKHNIRYCILSQNLVLLTIPYFETNF